MSPEYAGHASEALGYNAQTTFWSRFGRVREVTPRRMCFDWQQGLAYGLTRRRLNRNSCGTSMSPSQTITEGLAPCQWFSAVFHQLFRYTEPHTPLINESATLGRIRPSPCMRVNASLEEPRPRFCSFPQVNARRDPLVHNKVLRPRPSFFDRTTPRTLSRAKVRGPGPPTSWLCFGLPCPAAGSWRGFWPSHGPIEGLHPFLINVPSPRRVWFGRDYPGA